MADVEDPMHFGFGLRPVGEVRILPRDRMTRRGFETALTHCCSLVSLQKGAEPIASAPLLYRGGAAGSEGVERLLKAAGVRLLRFCECFEPLGDFLEALLASRPGHARIHIRIFVCFASNGGA